MPEVRRCEEVRLVFRVVGNRWQATRSASNPWARVRLSNLEGPSAAEHVLPVTTNRAGEMTAGGFVQDLLGLPPASRGATRLGLDAFYNTVTALRQNTIASTFLGGLKDEARILALEAVLGLWNPDLAGLEKNASEAESRYRHERGVLTAFRKLRDTGALSDPDSIRTEHGTKQREQQAAAERWQTAAANLTVDGGPKPSLMALGLPGFMRSAT